MDVTSPLRDKLSWLEANSREGAATALIPGPDDLTWLAAEYQEQLASTYRLYYPSGNAMYQLLNKEHLLHLAHQGGITTPPSWFPITPKEAEAVVKREGGPMVLKPRTHIGLQMWTKGARVSSPSEMRSRFRQVLGELRYDVMMLARDPSLALPFLQRYYPAAKDGIYNLSGFIDHTGVLTGFAASRKVLQYPRRLGVGVCFEAAPVDRELAARVTEMLRGIGFYGIFEAEFIEADGERLLIDFNPRVFQSVGLPIARGLRLPYIWYLAAIGEWAEVEEQLAKSRPFEDGGGRPSRWMHRFALETMVATRLATFRMGPREARRWIGWLRDDRENTIDGAWAEDDPWPGRLNGLQHMAMFARDPRFFVGTFVRD